MAEVRHRVGRGAHDFAHNIYNRHVLGGPKKQGKSAIRASPLSVGRLSYGFKNDGQYGAENAAHSVAGGASRGSYTSITPVLVAVNDILGNGNVPVYYSSQRTTENSLYNTSRGLFVGENLAQSWSNAKFRRSLCTSSPHSQLFCGGHGPFVWFRRYGANGTRAEPLYKTKSGYYEILDVLPSATQAQIKTAYYKQSFVYHPDRNASSEEATARFSDISEAYMVLGNKALRKKYDRGLLSQSDLVGTARPSSKGSTGSSAKPQTDSRRSVAGPDARGGVFDFDKFFKSHYNEQLQRQRNIRMRKEEMLKEKEEATSEKTLSRMTELCVGVLLAMAVALIISSKRS